MLKDKKRTLIITSMLTLSPILFGLLLWDSLPEQMTTHWGADGVTDGWSGRPFAVFGLPLIMLATHWLCAFFTGLDPKNRGQNRKVTELVLWIIPVVSMFTSGLVYITAFDVTFPPEALTFGLLGFVFMIIGNYMPKCKQNHTIGIKIKWTLENEENWNATHRMAGKLWVAVGFVSLFCGFLPLDLIPVAMIALITVTVLIPTVYSWNYHKKQVNSGSYTAKTQPMSRNHKKARKFSLIAVSILLVFVGVIMFTGDIEMTYGETSFTIEASYWDDLTVEYDAIDTIEYRENVEAGVRTYGFGSARLSLGRFKNEEFGTYTRYAYTGSRACVVIRAGEKTLVIAGRDTAQTQEIYETLRAK